MARPAATVTMVLIALAAIAVLTFPAFAQPGYCYRISVTPPDGFTRGAVTRSPDDVVLFLRLNPGATIFRDAATASWTWVHGAR